ncbi:LCP family protein [Patescibacteria group bacterium]
MSEKNKKNGFLKSLFCTKCLLLVSIIVLFLVMYFKINGVQDSLDYLEERDSSLITEIGEVKQSYQDFNENINEVREFLRMPTISLNFEEDLETEGDDSKNTDKIQLAMFQYFEFLASNQELTGKINEKKKYLEDLKNNETFTTFLTEQGLVTTEIVDSDDSVVMQIDTDDGKNIVSFHLSKDEGVLYMKTIDSKKSVGVESSDKFISETKSLIEKDKAKILERMDTIVTKKTEIEDAISSETVQNYLTENEISLPLEARDEDLKYHYTISNVSGETVGEIIFDQMTYSINLVDTINPGNTQIVDYCDSTLFLSFIKALDISTTIERKVNEAKKNVEMTISDTGFQSILQQNNFSVNDVPREDEDRYYYDIYDPTGLHISSIVVEKATAVVNLVDPEGTNSENILFFDPEYKKKTLEIPEELPEFGEDLSHDDGTFNVLIAGKHGNLVDTMIFAHLDETLGTVRMISIPRDLHYNGRKINSFPYYYGMPELKKVLSDLTGYELDKYILIDMYAFIDVIDHIGGVDIHLDQSLIDPTYVTEDDGVWGTLHYEPGDYHLGGKEALRLARSRHTSSDFARAERQQLIIEAIQSKARNFGFGDADTIYDIAKTVLNKTETDISLDDAIVYYFRYQNYTIESNNVMSSGNVLYSPPYVTVAQCESQIAAAQAAGQPIPGCMGQNHAYTLVPRGGNWDVIKWYFTENFEGEGI